MAWRESPLLLGIASVVFAFSFPWFIRRLKKFIVEHTSYGGKRGSFLRHRRTVLQDIFYLRPDHLRRCDPIGHTRLDSVWPHAEIVAFALSRRRADLCGICAGIRIPSGAQRQPCLEPYAPRAASLSVHLALGRLGETIRDQCARHSSLIRVIDPLGRYADVEIPRGQHARAAGRGTYRIPGGATGARLQRSALKQ